MTQETPKAKGTLREQMPHTAEIVDWLRRELGQEAADRIVLGGKQGRGTFWARERGPDGVVREFGSRRANTEWPTPSEAGDGAR